MSMIKKLMEYAAHSARKIVYNQPGLGFADLRSANFGFANFGARFMMLAAISLSLTLAGCDTGGGGGPPTCTGSEILKNDQCEACPDPQYPNADRTACVTQCPDGEIKLEGKPTCETQVTCTGDETYNPADNTCIDLECGEGEVVNTTVNPLACISEAACQGTSHSPTSILGNACIMDEACQDMAGHVAQHDGLCQECAGTNNVRNVDKTECISEAACQGTSVGPNSLLGTDCITDETCQDMAGHVATADGVCMECTGDDSIRNMEKSACISAAACQSLSAGAFSLLDGAECITDAACIAMEGHVAATDGVCQQCTGQTPDRNPARTACGVDDDSDGIFNADDNCPTVANADQTNTDDDGLGNACDADDDNDGTADASDNCPIVANADQANADDDELGNACDADDDNDGTADATDVDDDNDGLIEIATAAELDNIRHDLAGASYDDEADDGTGNKGDITGAPTAMTENCKTATSRSVYLCGYELVDDIDFSDDGTGSPIDQNGGTAGNFDPIGSDQSGERFTARLHGNGHSISNLNIDITGRAAADDHTNDAGLFAACDNADISNLTLTNPTIRGRRRVGALCGGTSGTRLSNAHVAGGSIQGDSASTVDLSIGGLVGWADSSELTGSSSGNVSDGGGGIVDSMGGLVGQADNSEITGSSASGNVSDGGGGIVNSMGGLVGWANSSEITGSSASGNVSDGGDKTDRMGGLVGQATNSSQITGSRASGNVSDGGGGGDQMGGLVGRANSSEITGSSASGNVSDGGGGTDQMGGLVGQAANSSQITGSRASGSVSNGGVGEDRMGGLIGFLGYGIVRDSLSLGSVCDGVLTTSCAAGAGNDEIGVLIGRFYGQDATSKSEVYNCLAAGATSGHTGDNVGFFGRIQNGSQTQLDAAIANNRFDTEASGVTAKAGSATGGVMIADLSGITGAGTEATQPATAWLDTDTDTDDVPDASSWLATRWLFASGVYPRLLYFDFDPASPTTENPTATTTIDVCETITNNDPLEDEGDENVPDCGDVLEAWPRPTTPADAVFHPVPDDLMLTENVDGSSAAVAIGSPVTAADANFEAVTYSLKAGAPAGYAINSATGQLSYTGSGEDYEMHMSRSLTVIATSIGADGTETGVEQVVTITIVDVDGS